jgi:hypothetical protein
VVEIVLELVVVHPLLVEDKVAVQTFLWTVCVLALDLQDHRVSAVRKESMVVVVNDRVTVLVAELCNPAEANLG